MAQSGSINTRFTSWDLLRFRWYITSQDVLLNTSYISWDLSLVSESDGQISSTAEKSWQVYVNGVKYEGKASVAIGNNQTKTIASGTSTILHNTDGSKSFPFQFYLDLDITFSGEKINTVSGSGTGVLDIIHRASRPSLVTWPDSTANVGDFGEEFSIHMNRQHSSFTHTVRYEYGKRTGTIATGVGTGTTWAVPLSFMNDIPNATSGSGWIYVDTYNGSTKVGTMRTGFTATVPASVKPTCSLTLEDITGIDDIYGSPVQGLSKIKITVNTTPAYSSPITSGTINAEGANHTGLSATTGVLQVAGSSKISATVKDSRGRSGSASYTMNVQAYKPPQISSLTVHRCDADGTENDQGTHVRVLFSAVIFSMSGKNTARYTLRYKNTTESTWTEVALSALDNVFTVTGQGHIFPADESSSYDVEVTAADRHSSITRATSASTAFSLMDWHPSGTGLRFGGVAELANTLQNDLELMQKGNRYAFNTPGVAGTEGFIRMASITIVAANADTPITFIFSRRQEMTDMKVSIQLRNSTMDSSTLSSIRYEGSNYGAFLVQAGALVWDLYVEKGSNYDTIALQDWYTSKTMAGRIRVSFPGTLVDTVPTPYHRATPAVLESILDAFMPVGFVLTLYSHADPNTMYPGTTWVRIENAFLWSTTSGGTIGQTGKTSATTGGSGLAYIQVSVWRRTA